MSKFDQFLEDVQRQARENMDRRIRWTENQSSLGDGLSARSPRFSDADREALLSEAEQQAVGRVMALLRQAAFPEKCPPGL